MYVGGSFVSLGALFGGNSYVAAVDSVSGAAATWNPKADAAVRALAAAGGSVYLGGEFTALGVDRVSGFGMVAQ